MCVCRHFHWKTTLPPPPPIKLLNNSKRRKKTSHGSENGCKPTRELSNVTPLLCLGFGVCIVEVYSVIKGVNADVASHAVLQSANVQLHTQTCPWIFQDDRSSIQCKFVCRYTTLITYHCTVNIYRVTSEKGPCSMLDIFVRMKMSP